VSFGQPTPEPAPAVPPSGATRVDRVRRASRRRPALAAVLAIGILVSAGGSAPVRAEDVASPPPDLTPSAQPTPVPTATPDATSTPTPAPTPTSAPSATPAPSPSPTPPPSPTSVVITRSLYRSGAVVEQYTGYWCVPASVQTMANLILGTKDTSYATQKLLASVTYRFNRYRYGDPGNGNDIRGWAGALNWRLPDTLPVVYRDRSYASRQAALHAIVDAIDETGYPVGITVWHGGHAWSVVGYQVRQVPGDRSTREFLGFYVVGPLGSPRDPWPVKYQTIDRFLDQYTRYYENRKREPWHLDWVLVRPELTSTSARDWRRP
jgi:hypothetical protein